MTKFEKITALKGYQKIEAIENLAGDESRAEILLNLAKTQNGEAKDTALRVLANLNSPLSREAFKEMIGKKGWGEKAFTGATGDMASEVVAVRTDRLFAH